jgi:hypothetical protein
MITTHVAKPSCIRLCYGRSTGDPQAGQVGITQPDSARPARRQERRILLAPAWRYSGPRQRVPELLVRCIL